jgi:hypothetical protein
MMPTYIKKDAIKRMFKDNGFELVINTTDQVFVYKSKSGFSMEFPIKWFDGDNDRDYDLAQVRHVLNKMVASAKEEEAIYSFMQNKQKMTELFKVAKDYGMTYDEKKKMFIYKNIKANKSALFVTELDFVIAARLKSEKLAKLDKNFKPLPYKEIFDELKESAEQDKKTQSNQEKEEGN